MRFNLIILFMLFAALNSCRKDPKVEYDGYSCPEYLQTNTSYSEFQADSVLHESMYEKLFTQPGPHFNLKIDVNCDNQTDFQVTSYTKSTYVDGYQIGESKIHFVCLNNKFKVLTKTKIDSIYYSNAIDTVGSTIYSQSMSSTQQGSGYVFQNTVTDTYLKGINPGEIISASDAGWQSGTILLSSSYNYNYSFSGGPDGNGYYIDAHQTITRDLGDANNNQFIAIMFEGEEGIKMGYIDFSEYTIGSFANFNFEFLRMHR